MLDFWLIFTLGFLGSFGHCVGMCGPLSAAFSLSQTQNTSNWRLQLQFHILLNLGRIVSYIITLSLTWINQFAIMLLGLITLCVLLLRLRKV
ncbi:MAG: sulfite exporter TauE/SafE family protein [Calothrix sp. C42_A2020_038]|nr:sulfite exporter TauE/SafE family protein [Calothrix sp. C42_A2020_038]